MVHGFRLVSRRVGPTFPPGDSEIERVLMGVRVEGGVCGYSGGMFVRDFRGRGVVVGECFEIRVGVEGEANLFANSRISITLFDGRSGRLCSGMAGVRCV